MQDCYFVRPEFNRREFSHRRDNAKSVMSLCWYERLKQDKGRLSVPKRERSKAIRRDDHVLGPTIDYLDVDFEFRCSLFRIGILHIDEFVSQFQSVAIGCNLICCTIFDGKQGSARRSQ